MTRTRVVRVPRSRAVAVVGALALTLSGGGVAAALTQVQSDLVTKVIEKATMPIGAGVPNLAAQSATPTPPVDPATAGAAWEMVAKAREAVGKGEVQKAIGMMEVIRSLAPKDSTGEQITAQVDQLEQEITSPVMVAEAPAKHVETTTADTTSVDVPTRVPSTTATTSAPMPTSTSTTIAERPSTSTSAPSRTAAPPVTGSESPATTGDPTPTVGNAGGEQSAGTATEPSVTAGTKAPRETSGTETSETRVTETGAPSLSTAPTGAGADVGASTGAGDETRTSSEAASEPSTSPAGQRTSATSADGTAERD